MLDSIADDIEDIVAILRTLNSDTAIGWKRTWGRPFDRDEVVEALSRLVTADYARVLIIASDGKEPEELPSKQLPPGNYDDVWFAITKRGQLLHSNWNPNPHEECLRKTEMISLPGTAASLYRQDRFRMRGPDRMAE